MTARQRGNRQESRPANQSGTTDTPAEAQPTAEDLQRMLQEQQERLAALEAENEALKARPVRAQRTIKPTPKQIRFMRALVADPSKSVPELCLEAGATETSHGFVFRMLEHGYLRLVPTEETLKGLGETTEEPEAEADESADANDAESPEGATA